jgi:hypothetical protein
MTDRDGILREDTDHKFDAILEGQAAFASVPGDILEIKTDVSAIKSDMKAVKAIIRNHEDRITKIEGIIT